MLYDLEITFSPDTTNDLLNDVQDLLEQEMELDPLIDRSDLRDRPVFLIQRITKELSRRLEDCIDDIVDGYKEEFPDYLCYASNDDTLDEECTASGFGAMAPASVGSINVQCTDGSYDVKKISTKKGKSKNGYSNKGGYAARAKK